MKDEGILITIMFSVAVIVYIFVGVFFRNIDANNKMLKEVDSKIRDGWEIVLENHKVTKIPENLSMRYYIVTYDEEGKIIYLDQKVRSSRIPIIIIN